MNISVCLVTHRRLDTIAEICRAWQAQPIKELFLADCSGGRLDRTTLPQEMVVASFSHDLGNRTRHALAPLTQGDVVIQADDDVMPLPSFTDDLVRGMKITNADMVGIIGRTFQGDTYYGKTTFYAANKIDFPVHVGFVGVVYATTRKVLPMDLRGMENPINDIYWQMLCYPDAVKLVVPTRAYRNLPTSKDGTCLFHSAGAREVRESFYASYYNQNYAPTGRQF